MLQAGRRSPVHRRHAARECSLHTAHDSCDRPGGDHIPGEEERVRQGEEVPSYSLPTGYIMLQSESLARVRHLPRLRASQRFVGIAGSCLTLELCLPWSFMKISLESSKLGRLGRSNGLCH
jgi:hypothetical protein